MKRICLALASLNVALLVAGCGGGGGGSSAPSVPTTPVRITSTNAPSVAKGAVTSVQDITGATGVSEMVTGVVMQPTNHLRSLKDTALATFARVRDMQLTSPTGAVGVTYSQTIPCSSGSMTISLQDTNDNHILDANEPMTVSFSNCNDGYATQNGSMSFAVTELSRGTTTTAAFTVIFSGYSDRDNASGETSSVNGDITFSISSNGTTLTGTMSGTSIRVSSSAGAIYLITNYNISLSESGTSYSFSYNLTTASTIAGGSVTVVTITPFSGTTGNDPTAGEMVLTGANGSMLTITARGDGTGLDLTLDDDGTAGPNPPQSLAVLTWDSL